MSASDRYTAIVVGYPSPHQLTLIDDQTGARQVLSPPDCNAPGISIDGLIFGGPYLAVACDLGPNSNPGYDLFNLDTKEWTPFAISSQCQGLVCEVEAVGRYWVEIYQQPLDLEHGVGQVYLQNIQTGEFDRDPVTPGGPIFEDLNAPSGTARLCPPLRYPKVYSGEAGRWVPGVLTFYGRFALTQGGSSPANPNANTWRLRRCGSRLNLWLAPGDAGAAPLVSSRAVIPWNQNGAALKGWLLPSLRRLAIYPPAATQAPCAGKYFNQGPPGGGTELVAVTARKIYVKPVCGKQVLWTANLPSSQMP